MITKVLLLSIILLLIHLPSISPQSSSNTVADNDNKNNNNDEQQHSKKEHIAVKTAVKTNKDGITISLNAKLTALFSNLRSSGTTNGDAVKIDLEKMIDTKNVEEQLRLLVASLGDGDNVGKDSGSSSSSGGTNAKGGSSSGDDKKKTKMVDLSKYSGETIDLISFLNSGVTPEMTVEERLKAFLELSNKDVNFNMKDVTGQDIPMKATVEISITPSTDDTKNNNNNNRDSTTTTPQTHPKTKSHPSSSTPPHQTHSSYSSSSSDDDFPQSNTPRDIIVKKSPCLDWNENCDKWSQRGECTNRKQYMEVFCKQSCDFCNPLLKDAPSTSGGLAQQTFDSSGDAESVNLNRRLSHLLQSQKRYLSTLSSTSPLCKNRHPSCAQWAIRGYCELQSDAMSKICPAACHRCHAGFRHCATHASSTPFLRGDVGGVLAAIEMGRIVRGWNGMAVERTSGGGGSGSGKEEKGKEWGKRRGSKAGTKGGDGNGSNNNNTPRFVDLKPYNVIMFKLADKNATIVDPEGETRIFVKFDSFLTSKECSHLLQLLRRQPQQQQQHSSSGSGSADVGSDGFGFPTTDARLVANGKLHVMRTSSRSFLPLTSEQRNEAGSSSNGGGGGGWGAESMMIDPMLESILNRIELITGVPLNHMETPIQFDKFVQNQFHEGQSHSTHLTMVEEALRRSTATLSADGNAEFIINNAAGSATGGEDTIITEAHAGAVLSDVLSAVRDEERRKEVQRTNPRVLGLTIFLSDVDEGGEFTFPQLDNVEIAPKKGRAVLYPIVTNLNEDKKGGGLEEDKRTIVQHEPVRGKGVKYVASIYLRQNPYIDDGLIPLV